MTNPLGAIRDVIRHRKILKGAHSRRDFRVARHVTFEELSSAGYDRRWSDAARTGETYPTRLARELENPASCHRAENRRHAGCGTVRKRLGIAVQRAELLLFRYLFRSPDGAYSRPDWSVCGNNFSR